VYIELYELVGGASVVLLGEVEVTPEEGANADTLFREKFTTKATVLIKKVKSCIVKLGYVVAMVRTRWYGTVGRSVVVGLMWIDVDEVDVPQ
jgi:hypothetical protein